MCRYHVEYFLVCGIHGYSRVSQPQHCRPLGPEDSLLQGVVLCLVENLQHLWPLLMRYQQHISSCDNQNFFQIRPVSTRGQNNSRLRTADDGREPQTNCRLCPLLIFSWKKDSLFFTFRLQRRYGFLSTMFFFFLPMFMQVNLIYVPKVQCNLLNRTKCGRNLYLDSKQN